MAAMRKAPKGGKIQVRKTTGTSVDKSPKKMERKAINVKSPANKPLKLSKKSTTAAHSKPGGSNAGRYSGVKKKDSAGTAGGAPKGSFPMNTKKRAKAAPSYGRNAPNPTGIRKAVSKGSLGAYSVESTKKKGSKARK